MFRNAPLFDILLRIPGIYIPKLNNSFRIIPFSNSCNAICYIIKYYLANEWYFYIYNCKSINVMNVTLILFTFVISK